MSKPDYTDIADISVLNANLDIIDKQLAERVTLGTAQNITGFKTFLNNIVFFNRDTGDANHLRIYVNNVDQSTNPTDVIYDGITWYGKTDPLSNLQTVYGKDGSVTNQLRVWKCYNSDGSKGYSSYSLGIMTTRTGSEVTAFGPTPKTASLNNITIPTMAYLNSESKATYLVHRAGAETLTGVKTFYSGELAPIRIRRNNKNFDIKTKSADRPDGDYELFSTFMFDTNNVEIFREYVRMRKDGTYANKWATFYDDNGVVHHPLLGLMTRKADGLTYAYCTETPANAPNNAIVTKGYSKMVTTDTEQTILSIKTFVGGPAGQMVLKSSTRSATSTTDDTTRLVLQDANSNTLATIRTHSYGTSHHLTLRGYNRAGTAYSEVDFVKDDDGNSTLHIPHLPSNALSTSVVDKDWVQKTGKYHDTAQNKDVYWNNLVHKEGNEDVDGWKRFLKRIIGSANIPCCEISGSKPNGSYSLIAKIPKRNLNNSVRSIITFKRYGRGAALGSDEIQVGLNYRVPTSIVINGTKNFAGKNITYIVSHDDNYIYLSQINQGSLTTDSMFVVITELISNDCIGVEEIVAEEFGTENLIGTEIARC